MQEQNQYQMRGNRVSPLSFSEIKTRANTFAKLFKISPKTVSDMERFLESLSDRNICIDPVADDEWSFFTEGHCDPRTWTIRIPESTYLKACSGEPEALSTIFHELGHLMLGHQVVLHNEKSAVPTMIEDAEWQADTFADIMLDKMKVSIMRQLDLPLGSK